MIGLRILDHSRSFAVHSQHDRTLALLDLLHEIAGPPAHPKFRSNVYFPRKSSQTNNDMLQNLKDLGFEIQFESHAAAILQIDFPQAIEELQSALSKLTVPITEIIGSGGGETKGTQRMRHAFDDVGWHKFVFEIKKTINGVEREAISHEIDHVKQFDGNTLALEIEWNNKDPFFDRDLENFKRLHAEGAISAGVIVTRGPSLSGQAWEFVYRFAKEQRVESFEDLERLQIGITPKQKATIQKRTTRKRGPVEFATAWTDKFVGDKYGEATTHWKKLMDRISRGVGNPCPLLPIGLPASIVTFEATDPAIIAEEIQNIGQEDEERT